MAMNTIVGLSQTSQIGVHQSTKVGQNITFQAGNSITLKVGKSVLVMHADGTIKLNGHDCTIQMSGKQVIKARGNITMKGEKILEN